MKQLFFHAQQLAQNFSLNEVSFQVTLVVFAQGSSHPDLILFKIAHTIFQEVSLLSAFLQSISPFVTKVYPVQPDHFPQIDAVKNPTTH